MRKVLLTMILALFILPIGTTNFTFSPDGTWTATFSGDLGGACSEQIITISGHSAMTDFYAVGPQTRQTTIDAFRSELREVGRVHFGYGITTPRIYATCK